MSLGVGAGIGVAPNILIIGSKMVFFNSDDLPNGTSRDIDPFGGAQVNVNYTLPYRIKITKIQFRLVDKVSGGSRRFRLVKNSATVGEIHDVKDEILKTVVYNEIFEVGDAIQTEWITQTPSGADEFAQTVFAEYA